MGWSRAAFTALIWAGLVRVGLLQHVTWSVNSLCHVLGTRPFTTRRHDRATNLWPLALVSFGESWHNIHHSDPTCARHGVDRFQLDPSARVIRIFEQLGWAQNLNHLRDQAAPNPFARDPNAFDRVGTAHVRNANAMGIRRLVNGEWTAQGIGKEKSPERSAAVGTIAVRVSPWLSRCPS